MKHIKIIALYVLLMTILILGSIAVFAERVNSDLSNELVRLHVIANSDSASDQSLKLKVRDEIIKYLNTRFNGCESVEQANEVIISEIEAIEKIAENVVLMNDNNYSIRTELGVFPFPTKSYGDVTLPAGNYNALRVIIGEGQGQNWWCVLFPPLCFVDAVHGEIPEEVKEKLKDNLDEEEYLLITTASSDDNIPIKVRFKLVEIFQDSKIKISKLLTKSFHLGLTRK